MPIALLLAMQASGMIVDYLGSKEQIRMGKMGQKIEQAGINANIQTSRLETEDASLQEMKQLRMNLGTQMAYLAARGISSSNGTGALFGNESVGIFDTDEKMRRINQAGKEAALKAGGVLSKLHQTTAANKINSEFRSRSLNTISSSPEAWGKIGQKFGESFGMTSVGS